MINGSAMSLHVLIQFVHELIMARATGDPLTRLVLHPMREGELIALRCRVGPSCPVGFDPQDPLGTLSLCGVRVAFDDALLTQWGFRLEA
jgi:hypothetical protein